MFGFGKGKATLTLDKYQFSPGDKITGTIAFDLKKPVEASGVVVTLMAYNQTTTNTNGQQMTNSQKVFEFHLPLDGEKTYPAGNSTYTFSLTVPTNVAGARNAGMTSDNAALNTVMNVAQMFGNMNTSVMKWYVEGRLKAKGLDVKKKVQVNVA